MKPNTTSREVTKTILLPVFVFAFGAALLMTGLCCATPPEKKGADSMPAKMLPPVDIQGQPFLQIVQKRRSMREFDAKPLERQVLSNLLWAAYGVNRPEQGSRTAPSAHNGQYVDIYVVESSGAYRFDAQQQDLVKVRSGDLRDKTGEAKPPVSLLYVLDARKLPKDTSESDKWLYSASTMGAIAQNVYLFCADNGLNTFIRANVDAEQLRGTLGLAPEQTVVLAQSVGAPPTASGVKAALKAVFRGK